MEQENTPIKILVIDDENDIREGCERILSRMDCEVLTASNGTEGLELLEREGAAIVLSDIKMPGISGLEVLSRIAETHPSVLVIMITGFSTVETAIEAMKKGAYDFISKPFSPDQLRIIVKRALEKIGLKREAEALKREQQKNLADLETEQSRTRAIIETLPNGVMVTNIAGQVVLMNPMARRLLEIPSEKGVGNTIEECVKDREFCDFITSISACTSEKGDENSCGGSVETFSHELSFSQEKYVLAIGTPVSGEDGECLGSVINLSDITTMKVFDRLKSEFVSKVSHELRSPLSVIHEQLAMVLKGNAASDEADSQYILGRAKDKAKTLISLIGDILDISRIEAGQTVKDIKVIEPYGFISGIVDFLNAEAVKKEQKLEIKPLSKDLPSVKADQTAFESVFGNLISNAIKYTPEKGHIEVSLDAEKSSDGDYLKVCVKDNGFGIEERHLAKIFDKFYRIKDDNTRFINGTGLGLAIVKSLVTDMGGDISVQSAPGRGSSFTVVLPASC